MVMSVGNAGIQITAKERWIIREDVPVVSMMNLPLPIRFFTDAK